MFTSTMIGHSSTTVFSRLALATTLLAATPLFAIVNGVLDEENEFPNVGAVVAINPAPAFPDIPVPQTFCSGTLIHPRVLLTAGHCIEFLEAVGLTIDDVRVSFDPTPHDVPSSWLEIQEFRVHPDYVTDPNGVAPEGFTDIGVVILKEPVLGVTPVALPEPFLLDLLLLAGELNHGPDGGTPLIIAGYGAAAEPPESAFFSNLPDGIRRSGVVEFRALVGAYLFVSQTVAQGLSAGGAGDSGGPFFWMDADDQLWQVGLVSSGDPVNASLGAAMRTDLPEVLDFLEAVMAEFD